MINFIQKAEQFIQSKIPTEESIKQNRSLRFVSRYFNKVDLWQINANSLPRALWVGLFAASLPIPFQMLLAAILAILFSANIIISIALVWISNPLTLAPMLYGYYRFGRWILKTPPLPADVQWTAESLWEHIQLLWPSLLVGCVLGGLCVGFIGYLIAKMVFILKRKKA